MRLSRIAARRSGATLAQVASRANARAMSTTPAALPRKVVGAAAMSSKPAALPRKVNLAKGFGAIDEPWSPHIAGDVNDCQLKLAKLQGEFVWHHHDEEDECFLVIRGRLRMRFRDGDVDIDENEFIVVPRGVEHCPVTLTESCDVLLVERGSTLNTGSAADGLGEAVHENGSQPLTKRELKRI